MLQTERVKSDKGVTLYEIDPETHDIIGDFVWGAIFLAVGGIFLYGGIAVFRDIVASMLEIGLTELITHLDFGLTALLLIVLTGLDFFVIGVLFFVGGGLLFLDTLYGVTSRSQSSDRFQKYFDLVEKILTMNVG